VILDLPQPRPQLVVLVLHTLDQLGGEGTRQEVIRKIKDEGWFAHVYPEDNTPYLSQQDLGRNEPRWETSIAWARKDALEAHLLRESERNCWAISRNGRETLIEVKQRFAAAELKAWRCYMWTPLFKSLIDLQYKPGNDSPRPGSVYKDMEGYSRVRRIEFI
jgi:hypothetical protein